jgi:hypothetical protein
MGFDGPAVEDVKASGRAQEILQVRVLLLQPVGMEPCGHRHHLSQDVEPIGVGPR